MFEVGKQYRHVQSGRIIEVLWKSDISIVVRYASDRNRDFLWSIKDAIGYWTEHHEPVVERFEKFVWRLDNDILVTRMAYTPARSQYLGQVEVTLTDGKLTGVKILEN